MTIHYRELLKKYMRVVVDAEGVTFLMGIDDPDVDAGRSFTMEEIDELEAIAREVLRTGPSE